MQRIHRARHWPVLLTLLLSLGVTGASASPDPAGISVSDAWARATPPGARSAAIYLTLENAGDPISLVAVSTPVAERAELHTHKHEDGMMRMEQVSAIPVPAGGKAVLKPHGDHVMLFGLRHGLVPGESVSLTLEFDDGLTLKLDIPIRDGRPS